jgi:ABC-type multidrug transport system ATPase subunit
MNKLINSYLDRMGASYSFHLDESFNEIIKSRYRDNFTYSSFSEGEKRRIDLALMFTWREVAKIKNSAVSNLLILDEVGDSSMDGEGTDVLWEILGDLKDTNIFVISHRTANVEKFTSHIHIVKEGNFSKIVNSK